MFQASFKELLMVSVSRKILRVFNVVSKVFRRSCSCMLVVAASRAEGGLVNIYQAYFRQLSGLMQIAGAYLRRIAYLRSKAS